MQKTVTVSRTATYTHTTTKGRASRSSNTFAIVTDGYCVRMATAEGVTPDGLAPNVAGLLEADVVAAGFHWSHDIFVAVDADGVAHYWNEPGVDFVDASGAYVNMGPEPVL